MYHKRKSLCFQQVLKLARFSTSLEWYTLKECWQCVVLSLLCDYRLLILSDLPLIRRHNPIPVGLGGEREPEKLFTIYNSHLQKWDLEFSRICFRILLYWLRYIGNVNLLAVIIDCFNLPNFYCKEYTLIEGFPCFFLGCKTNARV
jgi:hypothetical protein